MASLAARTRSSTVAVVSLCALAMASPWAMGGVSPLAVRILSLATLGLGLVALAVRRPEETFPPVPIWPLPVLAVLVLLQLVPLPAPLHGLLAPGSSAVWHPTEPVARVVLGDGPHPLSVDPQATVRGLAFGAGLVTLALLAAPGLTKSMPAVRVAVAIAASGLALSVYAIVARALFGALLYGRYAVPTISPFGPFVSKNHFAGYVEMAALVAIGLAFGLADRERDRSALDWVRGPRAARVLLAGGAGVVMTLAVLASLSRGGILSLGVGLLALLLLRRRRAEGTAAFRGRLGGGLLALAVAGLVLFGLLPREAQERIAGMTAAASEQSGSFRLDTWKDSLRLASSSPLVGHGLGAFAEAFPPVKRGHGELRTEHAESDVLETLAETGALGLVAFLALFVLLVRVVHGGLERRAGAERGADRVRRGVGAGALAAVISLAVHSLFDFNLRIPSNALLLALVAALAAGTAGRPEELPPARGVASTIGLGVLLAGLFGWCLATPTAPARAGGDDAALAASIARPEARNLRLSRAEAALRATLRARPADAESWYLLAWTRAARGQLAEALALAGQARRLDPTRPSLGEALTRLEAGVAKTSRPLPDREVKTP